jgi:hypothetical protein
LNSVVHPPPQPTPLLSLKELIRFIPRNYRNYREKLGRFQILELPFTDFANLRAVGNRVATLPNAESDHGRITAFKVHRLISGPSRRGSSPG